MREMGREREKERFGDVAQNAEVRHAGKTTQTGARELCSKARVWRMEEREKKREKIPKI